MTPYATEIEQQMQGFYSSLNERDRRRYAGIESVKLGWGWDELYQSIMRLRLLHASARNGRVVG